MQIVAYMVNFVVSIVHTYFTTNNILSVTHSNWQKTAVTH